MSFNAIKISLSLGLEFWLVILLFRRGVRRHFPLFFTFSLYSVAVGVARLVTVNSYRTYFYVFWWTDAILLALSLVALHEVFYWVYEDFYRLRWFQFLYYGAIALVLAVSIWNAIVSPPVQAHPVIGLILDIAIAINFIQLAIVAVFGALLKPLFVPFRRYPFGIVAGFGASVMGPLIGYFAISVFGTKVESFTQNLSAVAYILALAVWIITFFRQEPEEKAWTPPMPPHEMLRMAREYLEVLKPRNRRKDNGT